LQERGRSDSLAPGPAGRSPLRLEPSTLHHRRALRLAGHRLRSSVLPREERPSRPGRRGRLRTFLSLRTTRGRTLRRRPKATEATRIRGRSNGAYRAYPHSTLPTSPPSAATHYRRFPALQKREHQILLGAKVPMEGRLCHASPLEVCSSADRVGVETSRRRCAKACGRTWVSLSRRMRTTTRIRRSLRSSARCVRRSRGRLRPNPRH
jgi:hypothetical protein